MTETFTPHRTTVGVRSYRPADHGACRGLWAEFTEHHRELYDDPTLGGSDPGAAFEEYLTRLDLSGMWVAEDPGDGVVGLVGLILRGRGGEVDPVVVAHRRRGEGIGRMLLTHVGAQARQRGMRELSISPALRNVNAIHCLYAAGYNVVGRLTLTAELTGQRSGQDRIDIHNKSFRY